MPKDSRNIYQISRESTGLTQEKAAELLNVGVRTLSAYELNERVPPNDVVKNMIAIYNAPYLALQHIHACDDVARTVIPEIELRELPIAILKLLKELNEFVSCRDDLVSITSDGRISPEELPRWNEILKELEDVVSAAMSVKFAKETEV